MPVDYITGMRFYLTNNMYGDNDPADDNIRDPGAQINIMQELGVITTIGKGIGIGLSTYQSVPYNIEGKNAFQPEYFNSSFASRMLTTGYSDVILKGSSITQEVEPMKLSSTQSSATMSSGNSVPTVQSSQILASVSTGQDNSADERGKQGSSKVPLGAGGPEPVQQSSTRDQSGPSRRGLKLDPIEQLASAAASDPANLLEQLGETNLFGTNLLDAVALGAGVLYLLYGPKAISRSSGIAQSLLTFAGIRNQREQRILSLFILRNKSGKEQLVAAKASSARLAVITQQEIADGASTSELQRALAALLLQLNDEPNYDIMMLDPRICRLQIGGTEVEILRRLSVKQQILNLVEIQASLRTTSQEDLAKLLSWLQEPNESIPDNSLFYESIRTRQKQLAQQMVPEQADQITVLETTLAIQSLQRR